MSEEVWRELKPWVVALAIVVAGAVAHWLARRALRLLAERQQRFRALEPVLGGALKGLLALFVVLLILEQFEIGVQSIWATLTAVLAMIAIGFIAFWSVVSNMFCAFFLVMLQPFRIGDEIELFEGMGDKGLRGRVVSLNFIFTTVRQSLPAEQGGDALVRIPNNFFFQRLVRCRPGAAQIDLGSATAAGSQTEVSQPGDAAAEGP